MYCWKCGAPNEDTATNCAACGQSLQVPPPPPSAPRIEDSASARWLLPVGRSGLAIAAGYVGLFALFIFPLAPVSLLLGILALRSIRLHPGTLGKGRAWFAIVVGVFWILIFLVIVVVALVEKMTGR
jgi:hypothetical protein